MYNLIITPLPPGPDIPLSPRVCLMQVGDHVIIDGGMCELVVVSKAGPDVLAESIEQGLILSKANLTFRYVCPGKRRGGEGGG